MKTKTKRGRPPKDANDLLTARIDIKLLPEEKQLIKEAASMAGLKVSAWLRAAALKTSKESHGLVLRREPGKP